MTLHTILLLLHIAAGST